MSKCLKDTPPVKGKITIEFGRDCLGCDKAAHCAKADDNTINVRVHVADDTNASATPPQMIQLLTRMMVASLATVSTDMKDVLYNVCYCSGNVAEELQQFLNEHYSVKIHIDAPDQDLN